MELSLHGPNFQNLNLQLTFLIGLMNGFLTRKINLLVYALTKHVKLLKQLLEVRDGKTGQTQLVLLLTHITTTITMPKMKFVGKGVILHQKMVVHKILWEKQLMRMGILFNRENLTLNSVNSLMHGLLIINLF